MSVEADYVFTGDRQQLTTRNINVAYDPVTGVPYPLAGAAAAANYINRPYPGWGNIQVNRSDGQQNYNALQSSFTKRMANHWQASATYTYSRVSVLDQLPLNPGCQYPVTTVACSRLGCLSKRRSARLRPPTHECRNVQKPIDFSQRYD
jgi:hypothetical protein